MRLSLMTFAEEIPLLLRGDTFDRRTRADFETLIASAADAGFSDVDLIGGTVLKYGPEEMAVLLKQNHLRLNCLICMSPFERTMPEAEFDNVIRPQMDAAAALGAPLIMLVPGNSRESREVIGNHLAENFARAVAYAETFQIRCVIEDDPKLNLSMCRADELLAMTERVPGLKIVYDTANIVLVNEDPVEDFLRLREQTIHLHLKDIRAVPTGTRGADVSVDGIAMQSCPHGTGVVNFSRITEILLDSGNIGSAAVEYAPQNGVPCFEEFQRLHRMFAPLESKTD